MQRDFFDPQGAREGHPLIVYLYGGGFTIGERDNEPTRQLCQVLVNEGYRVAAIDYRLGMKDMQKMTLKIIDSSIQMGVEDAIDAVSYLYNHAAELGVNPEQIYLMGSSAGAIISLQTDYYRANNHELASRLP